MERLKRIDISDGLRLLVPPEIAQGDVFGCEVSYQEATLFDRYDGFLPCPNVAVASGPPHGIPRPNRR